MANSDKDIRIITNRNKSGLPNISFTGYNNDPIVLNVLDDNTISFEGSSGQLFSVSNAVTTGTIFSVNDISGIPSFRIDADGTVGIAEFSGNVGIGIQSPQSKLSVGGDINAGAGYTFRIGGSKVLDSSGLGTGVTNSSLTSVGTISSGSWQGSPVGVIYGGTGGSNATDARSSLGAATAGTNSDITRLLGVQHLYVTIPTASAIGITVKAAASQTANIIEFVNNSNSRLAFVTKDGTLVSGGYIAHNDGRIPGVSVNGNSAPGIVVRGSNSDNSAAYEVQNNPGSLTVGLYPSGLVYGGVLQAYSSTASTNATTGALIVAGGAGIANTVNIGRDLRVFSGLASSSPFTGALTVSGGVGISKELFVGGGVAFTASIASTSSTTGTLVVSGGVGIGGTLFSSSSFANSLSGVVLSNGSVSLTGTYTQSNSSTTAFSVKDGSNTTAFNIDTIGDVISLPVAVASTSTGSGSLVVAGGVGIGGTLNARSVYVDNDLLHFPGTGNSFTNSWTSITLPTEFTQAGCRVIFAENRFVATGGSVVAYSSDCINWTRSFIPWPSALTCQSIAYGNGYYVVTPSLSSYVAYSSDLINWSIGSVTYQNYETIAYGNGRFVANAGARVGISTDGVSWSTHIPTGAGLNYQFIKFINGYFYSTGSRSIDGIFWEPLNISVSVSGLDYGNGLYFGAQYNSPNYAFSTDGLNFTSATVEDNVYRGAEYHNGIYYLRTQANNPKLYYSLNGKTYQSISTPGSITTISMAFGKNKIVILGFNSGGTPLAYFAEGTNGKFELNPIREGNIDNAFIGRRTPKPANFTDVSSTGYVNIVNQAASASTTSGALVVRGGVGIGQSVYIGGELDVYNSINYIANNSGIANTWTRIAIPSPVSISGLTYGNGLYVGVGYSAATSVDGITWTARTLPHNLTGVGYGNGLFVGVLSGSALGATSTDGITWRTMSLPSSTSWLKVAYGNGVYVASADSLAVAYSYNGFQWTSSSLYWPGGFTQGTPVEFGGGYFIIRGNAQSAYWISNDGISWTYRTNFTSSNVATNSIAYGDGVWVLAGSSASLAYTRDLLNFTYSSHYGWSGNLNHIAYTNGTFAIVDANSLQCTLIYKNLTSINASYLPGPNAATTITAGEGKFVAGNGSTVYVTDTASHTLNIFPHNSGELNNVRIGAKFPSSGQFTVLSTSGLASVGSSAGSASTSTGALVVEGGVGIGGSLFVGNTLSVGSSAASTSTTTGSLIVSGGVGIGGSVYSRGRFNFGILSAPTMGSLSGFGTGGLTPSTTYYYKVSAFDINNNESLPSPEYSVTLSSVQGGVRFYIYPSPGAVGYKIYRTTTSGNYTNSYVQNYRVNQWINGIFYYDVGKSTSTGTPLSTLSGNISTLGTSAESVSNVLPSLTIPTGTLQVKSPNFLGVSNNGGYAPAIETGTSDFVALREIFGLNGVSASTGGTLTPGQTYYYVATIVDHYGIESLPTQELAFTADAGGAAIIGFNVSSVQIPTIRIYRTTTPGNYTNSYLGELPGNKDIGYPTMSGSPPTTTSFAGIRLNPRADFGAMSYIPNLELAPSHRNGMLRKLDTPYTGAIAVTTSGVGGSLLPNTTYYYKCAAFDIFGNSAYPTAEVSVSTGTSTAVTISGGSGIIYAKVYRSTTKNSYSNVPTYYVNSFPFTDRGDTTFTDTPSGSSRYIQSQLFWNENNQVPQNYLRDLSIGPIFNNFPFTILAPSAALNSVTAATGGTLVAGQVYYYIMEAADTFNFVSCGREPIRFVATAGGAANVSQGIVGGYGYVSWNLYRTSNLASWANSLIASGIKGSSFIDYGYPGRSGSPNFGFQRTRNVIYDNAGVFHIPQIVNQVYGQNLTATSTPYRTGGNSAGSLTTNTTYYYRVVPYGGANQSAGYASDEFQYTTGANERNISLSIGGHKIGAMYYRVYRSTTFNNFSNAYYFETPHINFTDYGHTTLQATPDIGALSNPRSNTVNLLNQAGFNYLSYTFITGQSGGLKIHLKSPVVTSISSGTGGTLSTNTDYWYKVEAVDVHGIRTFASDEAYINTGSNNSVTLTWDDIPGAYYYVIYRAAASQTFANTRIASYVNARTFTDIGYSTSNVTPITIFQNGQNGNTAALFQMDNSRVFGVMPRTVITNIDSSQTSWYTDFSLRITSPPVGSSSAALLQVGAGFTNYSSAGFAGTTYGTQIAIGAATGFTGSLLDAQTAGVSRYKINFDGSTSIGSTTGSGSTSSGALVISGGVGIGQSLFTSTAYASSISGAIFSNGSATLSGAFIQNNTSTTAFRVRDASGTTVLNIDTLNDIVSLPIAIASTNTSTGSLLVAGGVGISGQLSFARASFGFTGITTNPTMSFIGATSSSPITLTVLTDNSLLFEGSSGKLFGINNNLSTGWIFNIGDISGLPILRANANSNIAMGEFGGNVAIGISNPAYKLHVSGSVGFTASTSSSSTSTGALVVTGGLGLGGNAFIGGTVNITNTTVGSGVSSAALVVAGGLGVNGNVWVAQEPNSKLSVMQSNGDEGGEIFLNKPVTNTSITGGVTIDVYQNRLRFFEQGGSARGFYLDITSGANSASTNLSKKSNYVLSFGAGFTPTANSADSVSLNIPYAPDGTAKYYYIKRIEYRNETLSGGTGLSFYIQRHTSGNASWSTTNTITAGSGASFEVGSSVYSASFTTINSSAGIAGSVVSGDYVRLYFTTVGSAANVSIAITIEEQ